MSDDNSILATEEALNGLLEELSKLKSAVQQIEDAKNTSVTLQDTADKLVANTVDVVDKGKRIFDLIGDIKFKNRFDRIDSDLQTLRESAKSQEAEIGRLLEGNRRTAYFLIGVLVLQILTIAVVLWAKG